MSSSDASDADKPGLERLDSYGRGAFWYVIEPTELEAAVNRARVS